MNTTDTVTKASLRELATSILAKRKEIEKVTAENEAAKAALDALPKTPTGKDTKAVKVAKEALNAKHVTLNERLTSARIEFVHAAREHAEVHNLVVTSMHSTRNALATLGYEYDANLTYSVRETDKLIRKHNEEHIRKECIWNYGIGKNDFIFKNSAGTYLVMCVCANGVSLRYIGGGTSETPYGWTFMKDANHIHGWSPFKHGRNSVNLCAIGEETFTDVEVRLVMTLEAVRIMRHVNESLPIIDIDYSFESIGYDYELLTFLRDNPEANFGFRRSEKRGVEPCAFFPEIEDKSIVYGTSAN